MRHRYDCPLRWADLDLYSHVNNVKYVDFLQEARSAMLRACLRGAGVERNPGEAYVVVRHEVGFRAPLQLRSETVAIESWVSEVRAASFTLDHEIFDAAPDGTRTVYLRARTVLSPFDVSGSMVRRLSPQEREALAPYRESGVDAGSLKPVRVALDRASAIHYPAHVRFSDIDMYRHVNNVKYVEYFQEARIAMVRGLRDALREFPKLSVVVAQTDLEYVAPMTLRNEPYDTWSTISSVGSRSLTIEAEITDGAGGALEARTMARCRAVLVHFDPATQRSVAPPPGYLDAVMAAVNRGATG